MVRRSLQLLPKTSLHLPSPGCRLKWSNIPYPQLACLCFPKEMRHMQSRCSSALPSPSHSNPGERRNTAMEAGKGTKAPAVTHPLGWAESGRSSFWLPSMCQFARRDGTEELWLVGAGGRSPRSRGNRLSSQEELMQQLRRAKPHIRLQHG